MSDWVGGHGNNDFSNASNWNPNGVPSYQSVTIGAGSTIVLTGDEVLTSGHGTTLTGEGAITIGGAYSLQIDNNLYVTAGETLVLSSSNIIDSTGLEIAGAGTFEISGGSFSNSHELDIASGQDLYLHNTDFSTNSPILGDGTITLSGSTLDVPNDHPATAISFVGSNNTLVIPDQGYNEGPLENFGFGDTIQTSTDDTLSLVANQSSGGYELVASISNYTEVISDNVSLPAHVTPADFTNNNGQFFAKSQAMTSCFMPGTAIATPHGEMPVETLKAGDLVTLSDGRIAPISWLGRQTISTRFADPMRVLPIRIRAGALAENRPARDLRISPDHAVLIDDILVQAGALVNGVSITRDSTVPETFIYYHVEVADHSLILAENFPAETFVDNVDRLAFDNWDEHPEPDADSIAEMDYPRVRSARQLPPALRARLTARAAQIHATERAAA